MVFNRVEWKEDSYSAGSELVPGHRPSIVDPRPFRDPIRMSAGDGEWMILCYGGFLFWTLRIQPHPRISRMGNKTSAVYQSPTSANSVVISTAAAASIRAYPTDATSQLLTQTERGER